MASWVVAQVAGPINLQGSGGSVSTAGGYVIHTYTTTGASSFVAPPGVTSVEVLVVGGGGAGGTGDNTFVGGGGGSGDVVEGVINVTPGTIHTVTVGAGGTAGATAGGASSFAGGSTLTAAGGGRGGGSANVNGSTGASGGGAGVNGATEGTAGSATAGFAGGASLGAGGGQASRRAGGGGGGQAAAGSAGTRSGNDGIGGAGGAGVAGAVFGGTYGGGGGGGGRVFGGGGGAGGGGAGSTGAGANATANTGGGGGGAANGAGGLGGSGRVMIRYLDLQPRIQITQQTSSPATNGAVLPQAIQVSVTNSASGPGTPISPSVTVNASIASGSGSLAGTTSVATTTGVANFNNLIINGTGNHTIRFSITNVSGEVISNVIAVQDPVAQDLSINTSPSSVAQDGVIFEDQPVIAAIDGNAVAAAGIEVTASILSGGGTLSGDVTATTDANGLAAFTDLAISGGGTGPRVLRFTAPAWTQVDSGDITVTIPALSIQTQPSPSATSGQALSLQPAVAVLDVYGNPVSGVQVSVALDSGAGVLGGTLSATSDANGLATFTDLVITGVDGSRTLVFSATGWSNVVSGTISVSAVPLDPLAIQVQPSLTAQSGIALAVAPVVVAIEPGPVAAPNVQVTASIVSGAGVLSGTTQVLTNAQGEAVFPGLVITGNPDNYILRFSADDWTAIDSDTIVLSEPALAVSQQASTEVESGVAFAVQPVIEVRDIYNNLVPGVQVTTSLFSGSGVLGGTLTATSNASGLAVFSNLSLTGAAGDNTLLFSADTWSDVVSATITIPVPDALSINTQPSPIAQSDVVLQQQPVVAAIDPDSNPIAGVEVTASIFSGGGTLLGTATATTDALGLATFTDLAVSGAAGDRILRFSADDWDAIDSAVVAVQVPTLTINTQPSPTALTTTVLAQQPVILVEDIYGASVAGVTVTAAIGTGGGSLAGTLTANSDVNGLATFTDLAITGTGNQTLSFNAPGWNEVVSNVVAISQPPGACDNFQTGLIGSQQVLLAGCMDVGVTGTSQVIVPVPAGAAAGDLLVTVFASRGSSISVNALAGWTSLMNANTTNNNGGGSNRQSLIIRSRIADGSEPASYTFTTSAAAQTYAFMLRFTGASGNILMGTVATSNSSSPATAPALLTAVENSLIVRLASVQGAGSMVADQNPVIAGLRNITQDVSDTAFGSGAYFNQETIANVGTQAFVQSANVPWVAQTLAIEPEPVLHYIDIDHAAVYPLCQASSPVTITVRNLADDSVAADFEGVVTVSNSVGAGDYAVTGYPGNFSNTGGGAATYEFIAADDGQVVLDFTAAAAAPAITFDATSGFIARDAGYALSMNAGNCSFSITHAGTGGTCAANPIAVQVLDHLGDPVLDYAGQITITASPGTGNWSNGFGGAGIFDAGTLGDGISVYTFDVTDDGAVTLGYRNTSAAVYDFVVTASNVPTISFNSGDLTISACRFRIVYVDGSATGDVCRAEAVSISVVDAGGAPVTFTGTMNISTTGVTGGNWSKTTTPTDANGTLTDLTPNDAAASYVFTADDNGDIVLNFQNNTAQTVNFNLSAAGVSQPSGGFDPDLTVNACSFRIEHVGGNTTDVCSIKEIDITLKDSAGITVSNYVGTVNLSTTTGAGSWGGNAGLNDPVANDGNATYNFTLADSGTVRLQFSHGTGTGTTNVNVSNGVSLDARNFASPYDQNLTVGDCSYEISHIGTISACSVADVEITVRNSLGGVAVDYTGTMNIGTSTNHGNWATSTGLGNLVEVAGDNNGVASYNFDTDDNGIVVLQFTDLHPEFVSIDLLDGAIAENGALDALLEVTSCFPGLTTPAVCSSAGNSANITIPARNSNVEQAGRMLLMVTMQVGTTDITSAQFDGQAMELIYQEKNINGSGATTELWGILDAAMPATAGSYTAQFSGGTAETGMCLLSVDQVAQDGFPIPEVPGDTGPVNGSQLSGDAQLIETRITSPANNSFIVSAVANAAVPYETIEIQNYFTDSPQPSTVLAREWGGQGDVLYLIDGYGGGSTGVQSATGVLEVEEDFFNDYVDGFPVAVTQASHIVASFSPLIAGDPLAESYDPVVLFETFSGNMSYRAIGSSLRTNPSALGVSAPPDPAMDCSFVDFAVGREATLTLPAGSNPFASYLYWFGSGEAGDIDNTVSFGQTGAEVVVAADEVFTIEGVTTESVDFFAAYKDVTALVAGNGDYTLKNLTVQTDAPWNTNGTCAGGWSLITVYEHEDERLRVLNLFHGFQPFQNSSFTLVPRNFRMATYESPNVPNGQVTHITVEGDEQLDTGEESLAIQDAPGSANFTPITSSLNPPNSEFNSTITRPVYALDGEYFERDETGGVNGDGYEIDYPGADVIETGRSGKRIGSTWGVDVDTHYISPDLLFNFAQEGTEAEQITTRYSAGQDLVMLISEVISVTNFPLADLEIIKTQVGEFQVDGIGVYQFETRNNGNGALAGGEATGEIIVSDTLPLGMTFANAGAVAGTGWTCSVTLSPGAFTCIYDIAGSWPGGQLEVGASLPLITATVTIGDSGFFPAQTNNAKNTARLLHSGGSCTMPANGISPDPDTCDRSPQFDNKNDLQGGSIDINDLDDQLPNNNNVDSVTTVVRGVEVDLRMSKAVVDILEAGELAQYALSVGNFGPDDTTSTFTVTDTQPAGLTFQSAAGAGWVCNAMPAAVLTCTHAGALANGAVAADIIVDVLVSGAAGDNVTNTAQVTAGPFNFDVIPSNNVATDITQIVGPPVASQERFLLSVSTPGNDTSIGGLNNFENHDLIIYDPLTDEATMFFDNSALGYGVVDIDAVHLMKNGHIIISADATSTVGTNNLVFEPWDLVRYDPIQLTATMFLQGSTVFSDYTTVNISALYVMDDGSVLISTENGGVAGSNNLAFTRSDIIRFDPATGEAEMYLDGSESYVFGAEDVHIDAHYLRVDPADPNGVIPVHIMSTSNEEATTGAGGDPVGGTLFTRDDVVQLDLSDAPPAHESENLFLGDVEPGIFEPISADRTLDALHVVEDGYIGHFSTKPVLAGDVCTPTQIRISKHEGLTHVRDQDYFGSILISTSSGIGNWAIVSNGGGTIDNGTLDDGQAVYTYAPGDLGTVVLSLTQDANPGTVHVNVSNGIAHELASEDTLFDFDAVFTPINFEDQFGENAFNNNDGTLFFASPWEEVDAFNGTLGSGDGVASGNVRVIGGEARFTSTPATIAAGISPSLTRSIDFSEIPFTQDVVLNFDFRYTGLAGADSLVVEFRENNNELTPWTLLETLTGFTGSGADSRSINVSAEIDDQLFGATTQMRFRISNGYAVENYMYIDNVEVTTATDECGYTGEVVLDHYAISHSGTGIACLATAVTISGHDVGHGLLAPIETITLSASSSVVGGAKGTWARVISGTGVLSGPAALPGLADTGVAYYQFPVGETEVTLLFNHTAPGTVNFNVMGQTSGRSDTVAAEDDDLTIAEAGLRFYNETLANESILTQIAGKNSNVGFRANTLTIQAVRTSDENPSQCLPIFAPGPELNIGFAAECTDSSSCVIGEAFQVNGQTVSLVGDNGTTGASGYTEIEVPIVAQPSTAPAGTIVLNYSDVGNVQLHARYEIPFDNDPAETFISGDALLGSSGQFVVRPFGFDIDFSDDRFGGTDASFAADADGSVWRVAGVPFDTTVTAVDWQQADDADDDGMPDSGADLSDNRATPNFDQDSAAGDYSVLVSIVQTLVPDGVDGVLTDGGFDNFIAGAVTHSMNYDEVGIIDLRADIVDATDAVVPYMGTDNVQGELLNLGRFIPDSFDITQALLNSRADLVCTPASTFTYMDEEFGVDLVLTATNANGATTVNYRGDFAKLDTYAELFMSAIKDVDQEDDIDRSNRLTRGISAAAIPDLFGPQWAAVSPGVLELSGTLIITRASPAAPDGPFDQLQIAFDPTDTDGVTLDPLVLNVDRDVVADAEPGDPLYALIAEHDFRYGRMRIDNAYGPETEPLAVTLRVEYFDGERFVTNRDDSCSMIDSSELSFVTGTFDPDAAPDLQENVNEPTIVAPQQSTFYEGLIQGLQPESADDGFPLSIEPPAAGTGSVDIELNLDDLSAPLSYLRFEWLGVDEADAANDDYDEHPRARIEYGQFRNHDRVIHWQEIYNGATP